MRSGLRILATSIVAAPSFWESAHAGTINRTDWTAVNEAGGTATGTLDVNGTQVTV
jgi:hypothetical protein